MYSSRTSNTECVNAANPLGCVLALCSQLVLTTDHSFHLSDGTVYTYLDGSEYEDIAGSWDWNLIPGTTVDYAATPLGCSTAQQTGVESFVGGASDGTVGIAAMAFTNPITRALSWKKAWVFLPGDVMHVMAAGVQSSSGAEVYSVLDQRHLVSDVLVNGKAVAVGTTNLTRAQTLWHGNTGYVLDGTDLTVSTGPRTGSWSAIGTSTQPPETVDLFAAYLHHSPTNLSAPLSYTVLPGRSSAQFSRDSRSLRIQALANDADKMGVFDASSSTLAAVFWSAGKEMRLPGLFLSLEVSAPCAIVGRFGANPRSWKITVSDPGQSASEVRIKWKWLAGVLPEWSGIQLGEKRVKLPQGTNAGKSVTVSVL